MGFQNDEQRKASFKHVYGKAQVNPENGISAEQLETGHQIYSDELLSAANTIAFASSNPDTMTSSSIWTPSSPSDMSAVWAGSFVKTSAGGSNSNFEKVTMPLVEISDANNPRAFGTLLKSSQSTSGTQTPAFFVQNATYRLRNWVTPVRFGAGYKVGVFESNANKSGPDSTKPVGENNTDFTNKVWGGWAFDYYQGILNFANPSSGTIDTVGLNFPLWLVGYQYIGATGSAGGGISEIDETVSTNMTFNATNNQLTLGSDSITVNPATTQVTSLLFETSSVGKIFMGVKDSVYATNSLSQADKLFIQGGDGIGGSHPTGIGSDYAFNIGTPIFFQAGNTNTPAGPGASLNFKPGMNLSSNQWSNISSVPSDNWRQLAGSINMLGDGVFGGGRLNVGNQDYPYQIKNTGWVNMIDDPIFSNIRNTYTLGVLTSKKYFDNLGLGSNDVGANWGKFKYTPFDYDTLKANGLGRYQKNSKMIIGHANSELEAATIEYEWNKSQLAIIVNNTSGSSINSPYYSATGSHGLFVKYGGNVSIGSEEATAKLTVNASGSNNSYSKIPIKGLVEVDNSINTYAVTGSETSFTSELKVGDEITIYQEAKPSMGSLLLIGANGYLDFGRQDANLDPLSNNFTDGDNLKIGQTTFTFTSTSSAAGFEGPGSFKVLIGNSAYEAVQNLMVSVNSCYGEEPIFKATFRVASNYTFGYFAGTFLSKPDSSVQHIFGCIDVISTMPGTGSTFGLEHQMTGLKDSSGQYYTHDGATTEAQTPPPFNGYLDDTEIRQTSSYALSGGSDSISYDTKVTSIVSDTKFYCNPSINRKLYDARILKTPNLFDVINTTGSNVLSVTDNHISSSLTISASAFYLNGVLLTNATGSGFPYTGTATITGSLNILSNNGFGIESTPMSIESAAQISNISTTLASFDLTKTFQIAHENTSRIAMHGSTDHNIQLDLNAIDSGTPIMSLFEMKFSVGKKINSNSLLGSYDGTTWANITSSVPLASDGNIHQFTIDNEEYAHYKIVFDGTTAENGTWIGLDYIKLYRSVAPSAAVTISGSTKMSGTLDASNISASANISASNFYSNGVLLTNATGSGFPYTGEAVITGSLDVTGTLTLGGFTDVSASLVTAMAGSDNLGNHTATTSLDMASNAITNVTTVSASGHISASNLMGNNTGDQDLTSYSTISQLNASSSALQTNINAKATTGSNVTFADITGSNVNFTSINTSGNISASGNLYAALGAATSNARLVAHKDGEFITTRMIQRSLDTLVEDNWEISGSLHVSGSSTFMDDVSVTGDVSASGITTATSYVGSLTNMTGIIDGGTF